MDLNYIVRKYNISKTTYSFYFIFITLFFYFAYHIIFNKNGVVSYYKLKNQANLIHEKETSLLKLVNKKQTMVNSLNDNNLDIDLLDEQARKNLGYAGKNEIIIYNQDIK